ncbi:MAG: nuclear transport factor 2 family protein [Pseudomonadota bacterium]
MGIAAENVRRLYLEGIAGGNARAAVEKYTGNRYTQHSTGVGDGVEGFLEFFEPFLERNPDRQIDIVCLYEDGPWAFCSAYQSLNGGTAQWVTTDLFYTDDDGLILEHWDTIAEYVPATPSGNDMVGGNRVADNSTNATGTKSLVLEYTKQVLQARDLSKLPDFVAEDLMQHAGTIAAGRSGLSEWLKSDQCGDYEMLFQIMADGDFAVTYGKRHAKGEDIAVFDIYRIANNRIAEHWMNEEVIGPRDTWGNSGKF